MASNTHIKTPETRQDFILLWRKPNTDQYYCSACRYYNTTDTDAHLAICPDIYHNCGWSNMNGYHKERSYNNTTDKILSTIRECSKPCRICNDYCLIKMIINKLKNYHV